MTEPLPQPPPVAVPDRYVEVETKLDAEPGFRLPDLAADAGVRAVAVASVDDPALATLSAVYYDTALFDLLRSRLTLRRRTGGADAGWHLKLPAGGGARTEVRLPLSADGPGGDDVPAALADLVAGAARGRELVPVARIETVRSATVLRDAAGRPLLEVADDSVRGTDLLRDADAEQRWREVEVETIAGTAEQAAAVVEALLAAGARPAGAASKLGRLLGGGAAAADPAGPAGGGAAAAARSATAGEVLIDYLARQRDLLIDADIRLRAPDPDGEAPHDARAAARRIRSVLRVYRPLWHDRSTATLAARLQRLGREVSAIRDLDVARTRLSQLAPGDPGVTELDQHLVRRRAAALTAVRAQLISPDYLDLLRGLDRLVASPPPAAEAAGPPASVLAPLVDSAWARMRADADTALQTYASGDVSGTVRQAGDSAGAPDAAPVRDHALHRVRKDAKSVRYAADAAASAGGAFGTAMAAFAARLEQIQDVLGAHQDAVAAADLLDDLARETGLTPAGRIWLRLWGDAESERRTSSVAAFAGLWPTVAAARVNGSPATAPGDGRPAAKP